MFPEDIGFLFGEVPLNAPVRIINEPVKIGWDGDELLVEVHETLEFVPVPVTVVEGDAGSDVATEPAAPPPVRDAMTALTEQFVLATNARPAALNWDIAEQLLARADGIPVVAGHGIKDAATSAASK
jgi:L,D-transpeptidase ErfK/SrfK